MEQLQAVIFAVGYDKAAGADWPDGVRCDEDTDVTKGMEMCAVGGEDVDACVSVAIGDGHFAIGEQGDVGWMIEGFSRMVTLAETADAMALRVEDDDFVGVAIDYINAAAGSDGEHVGIGDFFAPLGQARAIGCEFDDGGGRQRAEWIAAQQREDVSAVAD
jgi:hypothetical protein